MVDFEENMLCTGCLCSDRKVLSIDEMWKKQCFLQIINEIPMFHPQEQAVWLCWECEALITRFSKFKQQVRYCYKILHNYVVKNTSLSPIPTHSNLQKFKQINITLHPDTEDSYSGTYVEVVKLENDIESNKQRNLPKIGIKEEFIDDTCLHSDQNSEDDKLLIDISTKQKILTNKKKKRKRKAIYKEIVLGREAVAEERRLAMLREDYVNAMFRCERCIISFPNEDDLKDHVNGKHELNASHFKCTICECSFSTEVSYNYHTNKHRRRYQCCVCNERFTSKRGVTKHYETVHWLGAKAEYELPTKDKTNGRLQDDGNLNENSTNQPSETFPCEFCDKTFRWKTSLRKHMETHRIETGQKRKPYCEPCRLSFSTTSNLQKHVKTSSKHQIQLKLRKLKESLLVDATNPEKEQAHIEQIKCSVNKSREQFPCPQCDKRFQWRGNLLRHLHSHAARANGELVCEPCNRTFSSIATYKQHMKISKKHVSETDFKYMCSECGKRFANKTRLKDHINWEHLKNYLHTCPVCQKVFKSHTSLYLHKQVVHRKNDAEHLCDHCGKPFPNHAKLRSHITALHTGESPYKCGSCAARFSWHSCLSRHVRRVHGPPRARRAPAPAHAPTPAT